MCGRGVCVAGGMCGRGHAWQGVCVEGGHAWKGGMHGRGMRGRGHVLQRGMCGEGACVVGGVCGIRSMSGRYGSYWNAFLCFAFDENKSIITALVLNGLIHACADNPPNWLL